MASNRDRTTIDKTSSQGDGHLSALSKRLLASWSRSQEYGVSREQVDPIWSGNPTSDSLFFSCGQEVLLNLYRTLADEPLSLMLTDADGLVLNRFSRDTALLQALDAAHLAPGFAFSERDAGTNGLGLALADRTASLVRAEEHFSASLRGYNCAAVPVIDLRTGRLEGSVNITTWAETAHSLLLALAQSAASNTSALMLARTDGRESKPQPKGTVFRVQRSKLEPAAATLRAMSADWKSALDKAAQALKSGQTVAAVGEPGAGRSTLLAQALRQAYPSTRILSVTAPAPEDAEAWLSLWIPELSKAGTAIIIENVDTLPAWAAAELRAHASVRPAVSSRDTDAGPPAFLWAVTAECLAEIPTELMPLLATVVSVRPLRERPADVIPLARHAAFQTRAREIDFTHGAEQVLESHDWPGNVDELFDVIRHAASNADTIDVHHLPPSVLRRPSRSLTRIESFERDEIIRCLSKPGATIEAAAAEIGLSRATIYRRMSRLAINVPKNSKK